MTLTPQGDTSLSSQQACVPGFRGMFTIPKTGTLPYPLVNLLETRDSRMGWQVGGGHPGHLESLVLPLLTRELCESLTVHLTLCILRGANRLPTQNLRLSSCPTSLPSPVKSTLIFKLAYHSTNTQRQLPDSLIFAGRQCHDPFSELFTLVPPLKGVQKTTTVRRANSHLVDLRGDVRGTTLVRVIGNQ